MEGTEKGDESIQDYSRLEHSERQEEMAVESLRCELFPTSLVPGVQFVELNSLKTYLARAAQDKFNLALSELFKIKCLPNTQQPKIIRAKCSEPKCQAQINLTLVGNTTGYFVVTSVNNQHYHSLTTFKIHKPVKPTKPKVSERKKPKKQRSTQQTKPSEPTPLPKLKNEPSVGELRDFSCFTKFISERGYKHMCSRDLDAATGAYPSVTVCAGSGMKRHYKRLNDLVYFDFYEDAIGGFEDTNNLHLATFATADTNNKPLLLGFAILTMSSAEVLYWAWELFVKIHDRPPRVLSLSHNSTNVQLIKYLDLGGVFSGTVVYRAWDLMRHMKGSLAGTSSSIRKNLQTFKGLMETFRIKEYKQYQEELMNDELNGEMFKEILSFCSNSAMLNLPKKFVGLKKGHPAQTLRLTIKSELQRHPNVLETFRRLEMLDKKMCRRMNGQLNLYSGEVELAFKDPRMKNVRLAFEKKIFECFLENYIAGIEQYRWVRVPNKRIGFSVRSKHEQNGEEFEVDEWECSCYEAQKTGIPCAHLLICARSVQDKGYVSFLSGRWRRQPPPQKHKPKCHENAPAKQ